MLPRAYWLPPNGHGNGLDAPAWAPIADVAADVVDAVLAALADVGVPGYAAVLRRSRPEKCRVWAASRCHATAEDVLRVALPEARAPRQV